MFHLLGIHKKGTTLIGSTAQKNGPVLIGVALAKGLSAKDYRALSEDLKSELTQPTYYTNKNAKRALRNVFTNKAQPTLLVKLSSPEQATHTMEQTIQSGACPRLLYMCENEKTYLHACAELGLSRHDFLRFAELKALLEEERREVSSPIGEVHKLIEQAKRHRGIYLLDEYVALSENTQNHLALSSNRLLEYAHYSPKFRVNGVQDDMDNLSDFDKEHEFKLYPGDYRLPHDICVFQYEGIGRTRENTKLSYMDIVVCIKEDDNRVSSYTFRRQGDDPEYRSCLFGGGWTYDDRGRIKQLITSALVNVRELLREGQRTAVENANFCHILPMLAQLNTPRTRITINGPSLPYLEEKKSLPFYEYRQVVINDSEQEPAVQYKGNIIDGREGVAFHLVRGYPRSEKNGDKTWIGWHYKGDPKHGVVHKSFEDESKKSGPPAKTLSLQKN